MNFNTIKRNYDRGLWTAQMVHVAVTKGIITEEEYEEIIGDGPEASAQDILNILMGDDLND